MRTNFDSEVITSIMIIDRSNPDDIVCITPKDHPENTTGKPIRWTRVQDMQRYKDKNGFWFGRRDLVLINIWRREGKKDVHINQITFDPDKNGNMDYGEYDKYLSNAQKREVEAIISRINKAAKTYPIMLELLGKY